MVLGHLSRPCFFGKPKFWGSFLNILYFLEPKTLGNPQAMHQTPIGSVKNPPIFLVKGSHFCSPWKKKKAHVFTHSLHPPPTKNATKRSRSHISHSQNKLNPQKKMHFASQAPPQGIANAGGRPTQRRHLGSSGQTEITSSKGLADVFFWLLVRRSFLEFPTHPLATFKIPYNVPLYSLVHIGILKKMASPTNPYVYSYT